MRGDDIFTQGVKRTENRCDWIRTSDLTGLEKEDVNLGELDT